jgi:hypothetical protein
VPVPSHDLDWHRPPLSSFLCLEVWRLTKVVCFVVVSYIVDHHSLGYKREVVCWPLLTTFIFKLILTNMKHKHQSEWHETNNKTYTSKLLWLTGNNQYNIQIKVTLTDRQQTIKHTNQSYSDWQATNNETYKSKLLWLTNNKLVRKDMDVIIKHYTWDTN